MFSLIRELTHLFTLCAAPGSGAQECSGTITVDEALLAEDARFKAQMGGDGAAMKKLFAAFVAALQGYSADKFGPHRI